MTALLPENDTLRFVHFLRDAQHRATPNRLWAVRLIEQGDHYGRNDVLVHDKAEPVVEFFDMHHKEKFGPMGQFVSRYYLSTLQESLSLDDRGLNLDGGSPNWYLSRPALVEAVQWAAEAHALREVGSDVADPGEHSTIDASTRPE